MNDISAFQGLPADKKEEMVDAWAVIQLLEEARAKKPRLAHDLNRIIEALQAEIRTIQGETVS